MGKDLVEFVAKSLVSDPDAVSLSEKEGETGGKILVLSVASGDVGKMIGKHGRIVKALRTLLSAMEKGRERWSLEIVDA